MSPPVVAVINTSPDIVDMLRVTLEHAGYVVVTALTYDIREADAPASYRGLRRLRHGSSS